MTAQIWILSPFQLFKLLPHTKKSTLLQGSCLWGLTECLVGSETDNCVFTTKNPRSSHKGTYRMLGGVLRLMILFSDPLLLFNFGNLTLYDRFNSWKLTTTNTPRSSHRGTYRILGGKLLQITNIYDPLLPLNFGIFTLISGVTPYKPLLIPL